MSDISRCSPLDPVAQEVAARLHRRARRQLWTVMRHFLPRAPGLLLGRRFGVPKDARFFDDKLLPVDPAQGSLLYLLARSKPAHCVVEFGTSFGVSAIYLAAAMRDGGTGGRVIGTELVAAKVANARSNLAAAGLAAHAEVREGDARETLRELDGPVDLLLLDGWPALAMDVLRIVEPHLADGAIVVLDNAAQFRADLRPVVEYLSRPPYRSLTLPINSGTVIALRGGGRQFLET